MDYSKLNIDQVSALFQRADVDLRDSLLNGSLWEEIQDKRVLVTKLSQEVRKKRQTLKGSTPAESNIRDSNTSSKA